MLCLLGSVVGFALIPIFLRHFADTLDAWTVNGVRYSAGALFWLPFLLLLADKPSTDATSERPRNIWVDAVVPSLMNTIAQALFGLGPYYVSASTLGFILRLSFLFTIVFGFLVLEEERLLAKRAAFWWGAALGVCGVIGMYYDSFGKGSGFSIGILLVLGAAAGMGAYTVAVRYFMATYSVRKSFSVISLYTSIMLVTLMFCFGHCSDLGDLTAWFWFLLIISSLIGIAFGHVLLYQGILHFGPVVASGAQLMTPFITYLIAAVCLNERMSVPEWIGGILLVFSGLLLVVARLQVEHQLLPGETFSNGDAADSALTG
jgi:drug/metabolite transporter (DMT)-like permease